MLRTPAKPISAMARETVDMVPPPACWNDALLTSRSSLCVRATSFRISAARLFRLSLSDAATRWMLVTASDSAGKSLLWRMRRNRKSSVPCDAGATAAPSPPTSQPSSAVAMAATLSNREAVSRATARCTMARSPASMVLVSGNATSSSIVRRNARCASRSTSNARPCNNSPRITPAANTSIASAGAWPNAASGDM